MSLFNAKKFLLVAGDLVVFYALLYATLLIRYREIPNAKILDIHLSSFSLIFFFWLIIFYVANLYDLHGAVNNSKFWRRTFTAVAFSGLIAILWFYILPSSISPKTNLAIYFGLFLVGFPLWRQFFNYFIASHLPKRQIAFIGTAPEATELAQELTAKKHLGLEVALNLDESSPEIASLHQLIESKKITLVVVATSLHESTMLRSSLFALLPLGIEFVNLPAFYESITGRVPINIINQTWFLENLSTGKRINYEIGKRATDLLASFFALAISLPFWPLIMLAIKLESRGPAFFKQVRTGKSGQPFTMLKFRTMKTENNDFKLTVEGDNRITSFGNFLRKTRLDELPQLVNIFRGEMSFVGPRPERPEFITELEKQVPFYRERLLVTPGITGWDQVSGEYHSASTQDTMKKLQYDLYYIKNRSIYLDLAIVLKTIYTVLSRSGR